MWHVTYDIVTEESAEIGDFEEAGFISEDSTLRDAISDLFETRTSHCGGVEYVAANCSSREDASWISVGNGMEFKTGARESRSLHIPDHITPASRARLCRLLGA